MHFNAESTLRSDGTYDLFPHPRGRGYSPNYRRYVPEEEAARTVKLNVQPSSKWIKWATNPNNEISQLFRALGEQYGNQFKGRFRVRGHAYKPYERWAWCVDEVHFVFVGNSKTDAAMFKLCMPEVDDLVLQFCK